MLACTMPLAVHAAGQPSSGTMLLAVSRGDAILAGGISTGKYLPPGEVELEPIARISAAGNWQPLPCSDVSTGQAIAACRQFARNYLSQTRAYTVVSPPGFGIPLQADPVRLGGCFEMDGTGNYAGSFMPYTAVAATNPSGFLPGQPPTLLTGDAYRSMLTAFSAISPLPAASLQGIRFLGIALNGRQLVIVQRSFADFAGAGPSDVATVEFVWAIGEMQGSRFHVLFWKRNLDEENEQVLSIIRLRSGKEFLVTVVNTPESQFFRVYGLQNGQVRLVFEGGGSSC